jgi:hypothetical protein
MPNLDMNSKYTLEILSHSEAKEQIKTVYSEDRKSIQYEGGNEVSIRNSSESTIDIQREITKCRLQYDFGTSSFNTFKDKIENIRKTTPVEYKPRIIMFLGYNINGGEPFETAELTGNKYTGNNALVNAYATLTDNYYLSAIRPLLYNYSLTFTALSRNVSIYGDPPQRAILNHSGYLTEMEQGIFNNYVKTQFPYQYHLPAIYYTDYLDLRSKAANASILFAGSSTDRYKLIYLLTAAFPEMYPGQYEIELRYVFPDGSAGTAGKFLYSYKMPDLNKLRYPVDILNPKERVIMSR